MRNKIAYVAHGGGPLPLMGEPSQKYFTEGMQKVSELMPNPSAVIVISAHWEGPQFLINAQKNPPLYFDYGGFPPETYQYKYPASGSEALAQDILQHLNQLHIQAKLVYDRGWDHGVFVPLMLMYPKANIPIVEVSILHSMDPQAHIDFGKALAQLPQNNYLILGSGASFHNLSAFFRPPSTEAIKANQLFEQWLVETCASASISQSEREERLINWLNSAPLARFSQPREEHLIPLHVCVGAAGAPASQVFQIKYEPWLSHNFLWE